jgi:membrane-associated phospholipid phosphatase
MSRGFGVTDRLAPALESAEPLLALVTQLGDVWFLTALAAAVYLLDGRVPLLGRERDAGLVVLATSLWAVAATYLLKTLFALPRPPGADEAVYAFDGPLGAVYASAATGGGYGFPSGHAVGAAAVYGVLAWSDPDRSRRRLAVAAGVIGLVALTRLGLGVHYLVDVVAGVAVGLAIAGVALWLADRPAVVVGLATATALLLVGVEPLARTPVALGGGGVGLSLGVAVLRLAEGRSRTPAAAVLVGGLCVLAGAVLAWRGLALPARGLTTLGLGLAVLALPATGWARKKAGGSPQKVSR